MSIMLIHTSWTHWVSYLGNQTPQKWVLDCGGLMLGRLVPPPSGAYRASLGSSGLKVNTNRTWTGGFLGPGLYVQKTFIVYIESVFSMPWAIKWRGQPSSYFHWIFSKIYMCLPNFGLMILNRGLSQSGHPS